MEMETEVTVNDAATSPPQLPSTSPPSQPPLHLSPFTNEVLSLTGPIYKKWEDKQKETEAKLLEANQEKEQEKEKFLKLDQDYLDVKNKLRESEEKISQLYTYAYNLQNEFEILQCEHDELKSKHDNLNSEHDGLKKENELLKKELKKMETHKVYTDFELDQNKVEKERILKFIEELKTISHYTSDATEIQTSIDPCSQLNSILAHLCKQQEDWDNKKDKIEKLTSSLEDAVTTAKELNGCPSAHETNQNSSRVTEYSVNASSSEDTERPQVDENPSSPNIKENKIKHNLPRRLIPCKKKRKITKSNGVKFFAHRRAICHEPRRQIPNLREIPSTSQAISSSTSGFSSTSESENVFDGDDVTHNKNESTRAEEQEGNEQVLDQDADEQDETQMTPK